MLSSLIMYFQSGSVFVISVSNLGNEIKEAGLASGFSHC